MDSPPTIQIRDLTRYYGATVGVEGLTLDVGAGEVFGFLGPNGAGKTTTIRLLLDLIRPTRGGARVFDRPTNDPSIRSRIGYLPGELVLDGRMTGSQILTFLGSLNPVRPVASSFRRSLCERMGLTEADLARRVREYSRGMKQKLGIVSALQHEPKLLILDEPTTGLDPLVREVVMELLAEAKDAGATVFHSSHVLSEVDRTCDRVAVLRDGRLVGVFTVEESRRAATRSMVVEFAQDPPLEEIQAAGARPTMVQGRRVTLQVSGGIDPLLKVLASREILHLSFPEPSLEEAFNAFYREPGSDPVGEDPRGARGNTRGTP